ncbi:hypothetical protein T459_18554 [Capsicum annuum]|uniref:F-box domain-containing protein n=1 Tax=Capsicum annuum TaxID=4072 RepID=A0A2G2ZET6_CAPAN|nr:hypothetical protein T459_18554 [Capsicum annuum]
MDVDGATGIHFNEEIVVDILSRLPVRSLLRFKCVSKIWMALISEPYFTMKHLKLAKNNQNSPKILFLKDMFTSHLSSLTPASLPLAQFTENNPSTRESTVLRSTEFLPSEDYICGLGYDATSGVYMILKIGYQSCSEILALKSGSWRIIGKPTGIYRSWLSDMDSQAFVHGAFHWLGLSRDESVTSYDISNEVFKEITFPDGKFVVPGMNCVKHGLSFKEITFPDGKFVVPGMNCVKHGLLVLGEMICICTTHYDQWKYTFNLWIMKDYGIKESSTRFFTILSTDLYSLVPEYRFSDGEVLLRCKHFDRCRYIFKTTKESSGFGFNLVQNAFGMDLFIQKA